MILPPAESGPFLPMEATVRCKFYDGRQAEDERTKVIVQCAYSSAIERPTIAMNGFDCDVSTHDAMQFTVVM